MLHLGEERVNETHCLHLIRLRKQAGDVLGESSHPLPGGLGLFLGVATRWGGRGGERHHPWSQPHPVPARQRILQGCPRFALLSGTLGGEKKNKTQNYIHIYFSLSPLKISGLFHMRAFISLKTAAAFI